MFVIELTFLICFRVMATSRYRSIKYISNVSSLPRLRVVLLSLSPLSGTVSKLRQKKNGHAKYCLTPNISRSHFFLAVFTRVTQNGPSERGTSNLLFPMFMIWLVAQSLVSFNFISKSCLGILQYKSQHNRSKLFIRTKNVFSSFSPAKNQRRH